MSENRKTKNIFTSYVGTFEPDSLSVNENGTVSAVLNTGGGERQVKGYGSNNAEKLKQAYAKGGETILSGNLMARNSENAHLSVTALGPRQVRGVATRVSTNFDTFEEQGKKPYVNAWVAVEEGGGKVSWNGLSVYGDNALALRGMKAGDTVDVPARRTHKKKTVKGEEKWDSYYLATGEGFFEPSPENRVEAEAEVDTREDESLTM